MSLQVGINGTAGGDGSCSGWVTQSNSFTTDASGNFSIGWVVQIFGCGSTSGIRLNLYADGGTTPINYFDLPSYYGYTYGSWSFTGWIGNHTYKLEATGGNGYVNFSSQNPTTTYLNSIIMNNGCDNPITTVSPNNVCNIIASGTDQNGNPYPMTGAVWTSNNPTVAAPYISSDGLIFGYSVGTATITVSLSGKSASKVVTVNPACTTPTCSFNMS